MYRIAKPGEFEIVGPTRYPWEDIAVGGCFEVPFGNDPKVSRGRVSSAVSARNRRVRSERFLVRAGDDCIRVFRVE